MEPTDSTIRARIFKAADELYEKNNREAFPGVDAVRRAAKVNMNDASALMKEWRRAQTTQAAPLAVQVPESVSQSHSQALASLWAQAMELANESLRSAQANWEAERIDLDAMRKELSDAYEKQAAEFEQFKNQAEVDQIAYQEALQRASDELDHIKQELITANTRAARAEAKTGEIENRVADLRTELERAHQEVDQCHIALTEQQKIAQEITENRDQLRAELVKTQAIAEQDRAVLGEQQKIVREIIAERDKVRAELVKAQAITDTQTKIQVERDQALKVAGKAREDAAELRGQLDAMKDQNEKLIDAIKPERAKYNQS